MSDRTVRRFVAGLLRGRRTTRARPDDADVAAMRTAIELRAARVGSGAPSEDFVSELRRRLSAETDDTHTGWTPGRRHVVIGGSVAAASAAAGIIVGRNLLVPRHDAVQAQGQLDPNAGTWRAVGASADLAEGRALAFDLGSVNGFVHRAGTQLRAVTGVCTHQGCRLWLDVPESKLRCPCHSTSFSLDGDTLTHQLPTAPPPLPRVRVRENTGVIEVFVPSAQA